MGMFSWMCARCSRSLRAPGADGGPQLNDVTLALETGEIVRGSYDGYGRVIRTEADQIAGADEVFDAGALVVWNDDDTARAPFTAYHTSCHAKAGRPGFTVPAERAADQGFFVGTNSIDRVVPALLKAGRRQSSRRGTRKLTA